MNCLDNSTTITAQNGTDVKIRLPTLDLVFIIPLIFHHKKNTFKNDLFRKFLKAKHHFGRCKV